MIKRIENFFFSGKDADLRISIFRIFTALIALFYLWATYKDLHYFYSSEAITGPELLFHRTNSFGDLFYILEKRYNDTFHSTTSFISVFAFTYGVSLIFMIIGLGTRFFSILSLLLHLILIYSNISYSYGVDFFLSISFFYCALAKSNIHYSIDNKFSKRKESWINQPIIRVMQVHLTIIYLNTGIEKALGYNWWNGESIWKVLHQPYHNNDFNISLDFLSGQTWFFAILGILTVLLEIIHPILVWTKRYRKISLISIISLHVFIAIILNLYYFSAEMILWNIIAFSNLGFSLKNSLSRMKKRLFPIT